ncbi:DNA primase, partial [Streptomyces nanshensis]
AVKEPAPARPGPLAVTLTAQGGACRHRTPVFLERGIAMAEQRISEARSAVHTAVYRTFLAVLSTHGRCGCLTDTHVNRLFAAAQTKGESARHCTEAWTNARTALGM